VVCDESELENFDDLRKFMKAKVPDYMVPTTFVKMELLPLTTNGKVDRKALPAPERKANGCQQRSVAKHTALEQKLMKIWAEVLRLETIGVHDNFFDLGGDSILGTLILARAARSGVKISPRQLFEHQTIAELSKAIG
jgi:aryl carrier-like protein